MRMRDMKRKKHPLRNGILVLLLVFCAVCVWYVNDYYHAGAEAMALLVDTPEVACVQTEDEEIFYEPTEETDTALLFYPGAKVQYEAYAPLLKALADRGILCITLKMPANMAMLNIEAAASLREQFPQIKHWYIGGHSMGGAAAGMYMGKHPGDFEGIVLLGAYSTSDLSDPTVYPDFRALSIYGSRDGVLNMENYEKYWGNLPEGVEEVVIEGGCHAFFGDYGPQKGDGEPTITREEQLARTVEAVAEFCLE